MRFDDARARIVELEQQLADASKGIVRTGRIHRLRTWPEGFRAICDGRKTHEVRRDDRGFVAGDELVLEEWDPSRLEELRRTERERAFDRAYTGRSAIALITYVTPAATWGLPDDRCVLSIRLVEVHGVTNEDVAAAEERGAA